MKQKFENIKHNKGRPGRKNTFFSSDHAAESEGFSSNIIKKGFVAWPKNLAQNNKNRTCKILEGRTQSGGYVAFPKQALR
jgi:hypothetical protein